MHFQLMKMHLYLKKMQNLFLEMHFEFLEIHFDILEMHFKKLKIHLQNYDDTFFVQIKWVMVLKLVVPKRRNSVTENGNSVYGKRKAKRRKFRTKSRKMVKISVKVPKRRNFFFKIRKSKKIKKKKIFF